MAGHRLLVVEDDAATQDALREIYTRQGWHVSVAGTEVQALACLDSEPEPCCLILDLMLPDGDGSAVLKKVRAKGLRTRVAVCSGTVDLALTRAVSLLKPDAMIPKPIHLPDVWTKPCRVCKET
jgi:DNA-binding response OmpR family regulator